VRHVVMLLTASIACLSGCGGLPTSPLTNERRNVHLERDASKSITVMHEMVWYDASPPVHELRFPAGIYALEAQDGEYWYMRSSTPLELDEFRKGGKLEKRSIQGGIMIGKYSFRAVPAAGYIDGEGATRVLIWKLGGEFINSEGKDWKKSF
jgi:hypothetical protein